MRRRGGEAERARAVGAGARCACLNLRKAARAVTQLYDQVLRPSGLRATQFSLLAGLRALGRVGVTALAEAVVMDRTTLTRNLRPLQQRGLIRIDPGEDRRVREVTLTGRGAERLARAFPLWEKAQAEVAHGLGLERLGRLLSDLSATVAVARSS